MLGLALAVAKQHVTLAMQLPGLPVVREKSTDCVNGSNTMNVLQA